MVAERALRVVITGAAGFIGSRLVRRVLDDGHDVIAVVPPGADTRRIADLLDRAVPIEADIADVSPAMLEGSDVLLHLAWRRSDSIGSLMSSLALIRNARAVVRRVLAVGSCFEYAPGEILNEASPIAPIDTYGVCKHALHSVARELLPLAWARVFFVYGPQEAEHRLVAGVARGLLRGVPVETTAGEQLRDYLHVDDVADALWAIARTDFVGPINVASGTCIPIHQLIRQVASTVGRPELLRLGKIPYRDHEPMRICAGVSVLREQLGWTPRYDLRSGIQQTVDWWRVRA